MFSIRRIQHFRGSFLSPGNCCILKPRNLLYCASNQYALLCGAFRINFCNPLKAALPCRNCVPYPIPLQLNYVHPHRLFMAVCSFFTHSMCQMLHSEKVNYSDISYYFMANCAFHVASGNIGKNVLFCRPEKCTFLHKSTRKAHFSFALFYIATLCNYHSPAKNAHCTFYRLANDTFSHSAC